MSGPTSTTDYVVYADIVGDLFHAGHVRFLHQAKALGQQRTGRPVSLLVGVLGDETVARYKRAPIQTLAERLIVVESCRIVDAVLADPIAVLTSDFLAAHCIDLVVHGDDMTQSELQHWYSVPMATGQFATVPYTRTIGDADLSTSALIQRILRHET